MTINEIHANSVRAGRAFANAYRMGDHTKANELLERYIALRRQLPRNSDGTHIGATEAYRATQGK